MNDTSTWSPLFRVEGPSGANTLSLAELLDSYPYLSGILAGMQYDDVFQMHFLRTATREELWITGVGWTAGGFERATPVEPDPNAPPSHVYRRWQ